MILIAVLALNMLGDNLQQVLDPARHDGAADQTYRLALDVRDLVVEFPRGGAPLRPVRGVSFTLAPRQRLGIVGESGSGKSLTALALMRLLPPRGGSQAARSCSAAAT